MSTSMLLFSVLNCEAEYNYFNRELISITNKLEANTAKLEKQTKYEEQYNNIIFIDQQEEQQNK